MQNEMESVSGGKKVIKTSTGLIVIFAAVVLFFGGALSYWYYNDPNSYDTSKDGTVVATKSNSNTNASNANVNANANSSNTNSSATADWKTYTSSADGFSFKYPTDWKLTENAGNNYDLSVASIVSPDTLSKIEASKINGQNYGPYNDDISVYYYPTVADETENKGNSLGATTLDELITKNGAITKIGDIAIGGKTGKDVILGGESAYYTIYVENGGHLYKIFFSNVPSKDAVTSVEKLILSTFQFTK